MGFLILFADMNGLIVIYVVVASQRVLSSFYAKKKGKSYMFAYCTSQTNTIVDIC